MLSGGVVQVEQIPVLVELSAATGTEFLTVPDEFDGVLEPLSVRRTLINNQDEFPFIARQIHGSFQSGNHKMDKGSDVIVSTTAVAVPLEPPTEPTLIVCPAV